MKPFCVFTLALLLAMLSIPATTSAATKTSGVGNIPTQAETEAYIRAFFKDTPVMIEIARCESNFRQFTDGGTVLRGGDSGGMIGVFQFFESIHDTPAKALGLDLATLEGNVAYAKHLYTEQGTAPWESVRSCWDITPSLVKPSPTREELEAKITQLLELIRLLKQLQDLKAK